MKVSIPVDTSTMKLGDKFIAVEIKLPTPKINMAVITRIDCTGVQMNVLNSRERIILSNFPNTRHPEQPTFYLFPCDEIAEVDVERDPRTGEYRLSLAKLLEQSDEEHRAFLDRLR